VRPDDDGRGFFSAGWGNGHEGVGTEVLEGLFVKVRQGGFPFLFWEVDVFSGRTCRAGWHRAPGLARQNRKQRLGEYAAECGAVLGFAASAAVLGAVGGWTKCTQGVGVGEPDSDEMDDDGVGTDGKVVEEEDKEDMDVDALAACVTIVFEGGRSGALPRYV
jgi:hypothetical protein